ncbi:MAG: ATP-dependent RecD-like DNA helicase [Ruminococcus sp.]|nr:ATP-dependent RecD-like DNA helicase [Ruminococcus sp.]
MQDKDTVMLSGEVDSIIYRSNDSAFAVIMLASEGDLYSVVGDLGLVEEGEEISCTGHFVNHARFGEQFQADIVERSLPTSPSSIRRYLASGVIEGISSVLAKRIVDRFGEDSFDVLENSPEKLAEIDGISFKKAQKFSEDFKKTFAVRSLMQMLSKYEIPSSAGIRAWKRWKEKAEQIISGNPYVLCSEGIDVSFEKADSIAVKSGMPVNSEKRIAAGIRWVLRENSFSGHTALPLDRLKEKVCSFLTVGEEDFDSCLGEEISEENLYSYHKQKREFIMLSEMYRAEDYIARRLSIMSEISYDNQMDFSDLIDIAEDESGITYDSIQRKAINLALSKGFLVLTGGPGTGKTTTLNAILSLFEQQAMNVYLAAPTGRAAKRLSDLTGHEARTIHRMLEVKVPDGDRLSFVHNENDQLDCDVLIIDEMSMVDSCLFEAVLRAISVSCKLVLVGDSDQLPSVGAGNVLRDIIDSGVMPVVTLTEIFRQAQESAIVINAHKIVTGEYPDLTQRDSDFFFMQRQTYPEVQSLTIDLCRERLPKAYGYDPLNDIQVLSPARKGPTGTVELNRLLQAQLNPPAAGKSEVKTLLYTFRKGDKVMQIKNDYDILWKRTDEDGKVEEGSGIFNGDIGIITAANRILKTLTVDFDGRIAVYNSEMLDRLELAYAVTVHKSQGSEYDAVILTVFGGYDKLYYRNLLYTAVTRAKKLLIIIGTRKRLYEMIDNDRRTLRYTCLKNMITDIKNG